MASLYANADAPPPLPIARAKGVYLYTEDGRKILDGISSWWVNIHGHSHPKLNEALAAQAREMEHVLFAGCTHRPAVELAERLLELLPRGMARVFYSDNGSTAVEAALKMALQYWRNRGEDRRSFVTLHHAYHGDTVGAMSASEDSIFTRPFAPMLFPVARAHAPYCYRCPLGLNRATCDIDCLGDLEARLQELGDGVAGVLVEPMLQGAGGMIVWPTEFLAGVRRLCDRYGTLMIADEVLTGFGRTGKMFACEHAAPDQAPDHPDHVPVEGAHGGLSAVRRHGGDRRDLRSVLERGPRQDFLSRAFLHGESAGMRGGAGQPGFVPRRSDTGTRDRVGDGFARGA